MNFNISFKERALLAKENLSKQSPLTLEKALKQVQRLKQMSQTKKKKQRL
jgi:hypothetical protein